jgi:hypothetical protein
MYIVYPGLHKTPSVLLVALESGMIDLSIDQTLEGLGIPRRTLHTLIGSRIINKN